MDEAEYREKIRSLCFRASARSAKVTIDDHGNGLKVKTRTTDETQDITVYPPTIVRTLGIQEV